MGYTHYWYRAPELDRSKFAEFVKDAQLIINASQEVGLKLAGPMGTGSPVIDVAEGVLFNGAEQCGHTGKANLTIPWPADGANGIASDGDDVGAGLWFAGHKLSARQCNGDCSYEGVVIKRVAELQDWLRDDSDMKGLVFTCCKTAYRPYDVTVTAMLIALKHHFVNGVRVSSDGEDEHWEDGRLLCTVACGAWGKEYHILPDEREGHSLKRAGSSARKEE